MQDVLILGLGHVGKALARELRAEGVWVKGTTTTPSKVEELREFADEVYVARGTDSARIAEIARGSDAIVSTVAPNVRQARNREEREATYRDALVASCESAVAANPRVLFLSSFSVYGDGGPGDQPITEATPVSNTVEPSARYYSEAEKTVLASGKGCVLRLPDIYGAPGDMSYAQRVKLAHEIMGGKGPFSADARLYVIHFLDVVGAALHALRKNLTGIYNVCDNQWLPQTNAEVFDALCERQGLAKLEFLGQIKAPTRMISAQKLFDTGYAPQFTDPDHPLR
ncbi:MAG TPA: NAD-dependent epimerase/dehydratase family protein [Fontimonas sp.]